MSCITLAPEYIFACFTSQRRQRDHRPTWQLNMTVFEHVAGNYYPVNSRIFLQDESTKSQFTILTDSSQGGSSLSDGSLELMVHRRLLADDHRGVNEALNEPGYDHKGLIVRGTHYVVLSSIEEAASIHRPLAQELMLEPLVMLAKPLEKDQEGQTKSTRNLGILASDSLPANIHLLTLQTLDFSKTPNVLLARLEHFFEVGEDKELSQPVTVNLIDVFQHAPFAIDSVEEMTLTGTQPKADEKRLQWKVKQGGHAKNTANKLSSAKHVHRRSAGDSMSFEFQPMQIRTFVMHVTAKEE